MEFNGNAYRLGPRVPSVQVQSEEKRAALHMPSLVSDFLTPSRILARAESNAPTVTCDASNANFCEKPVSSQSLTVPIVLGVAIPLVVAAAVLLYLHRRNIKKLKKEDATDPHRGLDFGMGDAPGKGKRKSSFFGGGGEKGGVRQRQLSMDMDMSTPYLLPPALHQSRESLHSLARTLHNNEDPYRPVAQYAGSEAGSIRSLPRHGHEGSSTYTASTHRRGSGRSVPAQGGMPMPNRQNSFPKDAVASPTTDPFQTPPVTNRSSPQSSPPPPEPAHARGVNAPYPDDGSNSNYGPGYPLPQIPDVQEPPPVARKANPVAGLPSNPRPQWEEVPVSGGPDAGPQELDAGRPQAPPSPPRVAELDSRPQPQQEGYGLGLQDVKIESSSFNLSPPQVKSLPSSPRQGKTSPPAAAPALPVPPIVEEPNNNNKWDDDYYDEDEYNRQANPQRGYSQDYPNQQYPQDAYNNGDYHQQGHQQQQSYDHQRGYSQQGYDDYDYQGGYDDYDRGRSSQRRSSMEYHQQDPNNQNQLGVPQGDNRRFSVGFRPLPPDDFLDSEDPEYRANRIRSFYKEYFDDGKPLEPAPPMPQLPPQHQRQYSQQQEPGHQQPYPPQQHPQQDYYEDYDPAYQGEGAYFDPNSNAFVMPYAQPVTRRAMTPPPSASRFRRGGPPPPRAIHGSIGGMSLPGGRGPRPGSSMSNQSRGWGPRPGSSVSGRYGRPAQQQRKKNLPPPSTLNTLPTPSKLKDDSFALLGSIEFAPPETFKDRAAGRSQSPMGERRPYQLAVPIHSPLVGSYEEMPAIPSPHLLRKSSTFTALDFAPPKRFGDDNMSDAGSIRSNRSGMSAAAKSAVRNGAGRVSRLPGDTVFTQQALQETLKPQWGMRP